MLATPTLSSATRSNRALSTTSHPTHERAIAPKPSCADCASGRRRNGARLRVASRARNRTVLGERPGHLPTLRPRASFPQLAVPLCPYDQDLRFADELLAHLPLPIHRASIQAAHRSSVAESLARAAYTSPTISSGEEMALGTWHLELTPGTELSLL